MADEATTKECSSLNDQNTESARGFGLADGAWRGMMVGPCADSGLPCFSLLSLC